MVVMLALGLGLLCVGCAQLINDLRRVDERRIGQRLVGGTPTDRPTHLVREIEQTDQSIVARMLESDTLGKSVQDFIMQADVPWAAHRFVGAVLLLMALVTLTC